MNAAQRGASALIHAAVLLEVEAEYEEFRDGEVAKKLRANATGLRASADAVLRKAGQETMTQKEYATTQGPPCLWKPTWPVPQREFWECDTLSSERGMDGRRPSTFGDGTLVSSRVQGREGLHAPCLDIDFPVRVVPSSTEGHSHLYFDVEMPWKQYRRLLSSLRDVGILQSAFASRSIEREQTMLIREGLTKRDLIDRGVRLLAASDVEIDENGNRVDNEYNKRARDAAAAAHRRREDELFDIKF